MILDQSADIAEKVRAVVNRYDADPSYMLQILREIQEHSGWLAPPIIEALVAALKVPRTKIEAVTSFYSFLYTQPCGRYRVLFSDNITDRMLGNMRLLDRMLFNLGVKRGETSRDDLVSIDTTSCTGMCDQGPAMLVNNRPITKLSEARIDEICDLIRRQTPLDAWPAAYFQVEDNIRRSGILLGDRYKRGEAIAGALALGRDGMLEQVKLSNLRGRGGAGFRTGLKWELCRNAPGAAHYVVCNADEGEPGTFKDRVLLTSHADQVFEGMTLCAYVIGAKRVSSICVANTVICWSHCMQRWSNGAAKACLERTFWERKTSISTLRSISVPAPIFAAKNRR